MGVNPSDLPSAEQRERSEDGSLDDGGRTGQPDLGVVLPQDHGHAQRVGQALAVGPAVLGQPEEGLEEIGEAASRPAARRICSARSVTPSRCAARRRFPSSSPSAIPIAAGALYLLHADRFTRLIPSPVFVGFSNSIAVALFVSQSRALWDLVANSGRFGNTLPVLLGDSAFEHFMAFSDWLYANTDATHRIALEKLVSDVESGFLGFTVTGLTSSLEPYESARRALPVRLARLLIGEAALQLADLAAIRAGRANPAMFGKITAD